MVSRRLRAALATRPADGGEDTGRIRLTPKRLAYHEAGHAVVNVLLDIAFDWAVALEDDGWVNADNPCAGWKRGDGPRSRLAKSWAVSMYSGAAAEEHLDEGVAPWYADFDSAETWLGRCAPPRTARFVGDESFDRQARVLRRRAGRLVGSHWPEVERVAGALLKVKALKRDEVVALMAGRPGPRR